MYVGIYTEIPSKHNRDLESMHFIFRHRHQSRNITKQFFFFDNTFNRSITRSIIMVDNYAAFFNCTPVGRASDSMMAPT